MDINNKMEYTFAELVENYMELEHLTFVISGDKFIETYKGDPEIRSFDDFVCILGYFSDDLVVFINEKTKQLLRVNIIDGKLYSYATVKGDEIHIEIQDKFEVFQKY
jgi:hypothetical protein